MIDKEIEVQVRECKECTHYLGGCKCRAYDIIPIDLFLDAATHNKVQPNQKGDYIFNAKVPAQTMRVYSAE